MKAFAFLLITLLGACASGDGGPNGLAGAWRLESFRADVETSLIPGTTITLVLGEDGTAHGSGGCNRYTATYQTSGEDGLTFDALSYTEMACATPEGILEQEARFLRALARVSGFARGPDELTLTCGDDGHVMNFVARVTAPSLAPGWPPN